MSPTAITRQPAAFGGGGMADKAVADKANETKPKNADDASTGCITTMQQRKGEYDDRSDTIDNIFDGSLSTL